jgi:hypothetical protein
MCCSTKLAAVLVSCLIDFPIDGTYLPKIVQDDAPLYRSRVPALVCCLAIAHYATHIGTSFNQAAPNLFPTGCNLER